MQNMKVRIEIDITVPVDCLEDGWRSVFAQLEHYSPAICQEVKDSLRGATVERFDVKCIN